MMLSTGAQPNEACCCAGYLRPTAPHTPYLTGADLPAVHAPSMRSGAVSWLQQPREHIRVESPRWCATWTLHLCAPLVSDSPVSPSFQ